jgi:hypothetical protein
VNFLIALTLAAHILTVVVVGCCFRERTNERNLKECTCEWIARAAALVDSVIKFNYFGINLRNRTSR